MTSDFKSTIVTEVGHIQKTYGLKPNQAFLFWFLTQLRDLEPEATLEAIAIDGANDKGIDLLYIDEEEGRVLIAQGKWSEGLTHRASENDVKVLTGAINWLESPEDLVKEGKTELAQAAREFQKVREEGFGIEFLFAYAGPRSANVEKEINVYNQNSENVERRRAIRHFHAELIHQLWEETQGEENRIPEESIRMSGEPLETSGAFGRALVGTLPGSELVRLYKKYQDRLFDRNVRLFLGARKGSVNAGISATIRDPKQRDHFWAYNNGVTIICDNLSLKGDKVTLKNFSIVNGCQTTVSLATQGGDAPGITVLARCVAGSRAILDNVILYTNSQNPIRSWDIASQNKTQRRLKKELERLKKPVIYLTRPGSRPTGDLKRFREDGRLRIIRLESVGQMLAAWRGEPVLAYKHKAFIFGERHDEIFPPDIRGLDVVLCSLWGEVCWEAVLALMKSNPEHSRILKKGGTFFALSTMTAVAKERNGVNFNLRLDEDRVMSARARVRFRKYADYSARLYVSAANDEATLQKELEFSTLVRQPQFYSKVLTRSMQLYGREALNKTWIEGVLPAL